jgi:hypothetical protein
LLYDGQKLAKLFQAQKICTMQDLKKTLGTSVDMTVWRKLEALSYLTSYSHRGAYYTLNTIPRWSAVGLWTYATARFSKQGTLLETVAHWVAGAESGYTAAELEAVLGVEVKEPLLNLVKQERLKRDGAGARYVYYACDVAQGQAQKESRALLEEQALFPSSGEGPALSVDEIRVAVLLFWSLLDEKQRRLYAGLESMKLGTGGDKRLAEVLSVDVGTIARGRRELLSGEFERGRVRQPGGGRVAVEKKRLRSSSELKPS